MAAARLGLSGVRAAAGPTLLLLLRLPCCWGCLARLPLREITGPTLALLLGLPFPAEGDAIGSTANRRTDGDTPIAAVRWGVNCWRRGELVQLVPVAGLPKLAPPLGPNVGVLSRCEDPCGGATADAVVRGGVSCRDGDDVIAALCGVAAAHGDVACRGGVSVLAGVCLCACPPAAGSTGACDVDVDRAVAVADAPDAEGL